MSIGVPFLPGWGETDSCGYHHWLLTMKRPARSIPSCRSLALSIVVGSVLLLSPVRVAQALG